MRFNKFFHLLAVLCLFLSCQGIEKTTVCEIAHRGGIVPGYPENTLKAFERCIDIGVDFIELDLRVSKDGEIVIIHDETLDRTTNGSGSVADYTLQELKTFDAGDGEHIPTLREVLQLISGSEVKLLFDIKLSKNLDATKILATVHEFDMLSDIVFGIRSLEDLAKFHALESEIMTLGFLSEQSQIEGFIEYGIDIIRLKQQWIEDHPELIASFRKKGIPTWTTVGIMTDDDLQALIDTGIDGIIYDDPEQLQKVLLAAE